MIIFKDSRRKKNSSTSQKTTFASIPLSSSTFQKLGKTPTQNKDVFNLPNPSNFKKAIEHGSSKLPKINPSKAFRYFTKPIQLPVFKMERSWVHRNSSLNGCLQNLFPPHFHFMPKNIKKSKEFYEAIITKTGLVIITHTSTQKPNLIDFSK